MSSKVYPEWLADAMLSPVMEESSCTCDPSVGVIKCEACVTRTAILHARTLCDWVRLQVEADEQIGDSLNMELQYLSRLVRPSTRSPRTHELKTWPLYFEAVAKGDKKFEGRKDEGFEVNDFLRLREWCPAKKDYTGRECMVRITFKLDGGRFGIDADWCVLSIDLLETGFLVREEPRASGASKRPPARPEDYGGAY
jgi:hypothetical protein